MNQPMLALEQLEAVVDRGLASFVEVGQALLAIRDNGLYKQRGYSRFEDYCQERFRLSRPRAYQLMEAAETVEAVSTIVDTKPPENEAQVRPLAPLAKKDPEAAAEVWRQVKEEHGDKTTAQHVEAAVQAHTAAERYPELKSPAYPQQAAVTIAKNLDKLPEPERAEKREALRRYDPDTVAALAERPPIPKDIPSAKERESASPVAQWGRLFMEISKVVIAVRDLGGLPPMVRRWNTKERRANLEEIRHIKRQLAEWEAAIEESLEEVAV